MRSCPGEPRSNASEADCATRPTWPGMTISAPWSLSRSFGRGWSRTAELSRAFAPRSSFSSRLNHPVVVRSFGADLDGPRPHVVLEHLEGPRLSSLRRKYGPLLPEQLVSLAIQLCAAIHYLAEENVIHLDVKPSNVIMGGPPRLIDLSVARTIDQCAQLRSPVGTDAYMAPEQARPDDGVPIGPPADVWGVGVTLFEALLGERPFSRGDRDSEVPTERFPQLVEQPRELTGKVPSPLPTRSWLAWLATRLDGRPPVTLADRLELVLDRLPKPQLSKLKPRVQR